jgi:hypothetical protein
VELASFCVSSPAGHVLSLQSPPVGSTFALLGIKQAVSAPSLPVHSIPALLHRLVGEVDFWIFWIFNFLQLAIYGKKNSKTKVEKVFLCGNRVF